MITYATVGCNDFEKSEAFFGPLFETLGVTLLGRHPRGGGMYGKDGEIVLCVLLPFDGNAATVGNGCMVTLALPTSEAVDAFHAKAIALGASDEGAPGERAPGYYMSYFRDPDGNKFCVCRRYL